MMLNPRGIRRLIVSQRKHKHRHAEEDALFHRAETSVRDDERRFLQDLELRHLVNQQGVRRDRLKIFRVKLNSERHNELPIRSRGDGVNDGLQKILESTLVQRVIRGLMRPVTLSAKRTVEQLPALIDA